MRLRILLVCCAVLALTVGVATATGGGTPSIAFTPGSNDFGTIDMNTTTSQTFVLNNTGVSPARSLVVGFGAGSSSAFSKTADTCTATSLGSKKQCSVTVQYAPTTAGSTDTATLTVSSKKPVAVATATLSGKSTAAPSCAAGSENFSGDAVGSQPTVFSGGTIDTAYGNFGRVFIQSYDWFGTFAGGTHVLYSGQVNSFQLTFTNAVGSVQLDAEAGVYFAATNITLTAYDASNNVVDTDSLADAAGTPAAPVVTPSVSSTSNNIKYFTIATDDPNTGGLGFSNIAWGCAA